MPSRSLIRACALLLCATRVEAQVKVTSPAFAALSVPDLAASVRWYRSVFGLNVVFEDASPDSTTRVTLLAGTGVRIELVWHQAAKALSAYAGRATPRDMAYGSAKIGFFVSNMDSTLAALRAQGATIEGTWLVRPGRVAPTDTLWTRNILVRDNSGT